MTYPHLLVLINIFDTLYLIFAHPASWHANPEPNLESGANIDCCKLYRDNRAVRVISPPSGSCSWVFAIPNLISDVCILGVRASRKRVHQAAAGALIPVLTFGDLAHWYYVCIPTSRWVVGYVRMQKIMKLISVRTISEGLELDLSFLIPSERR